MHGNRDFLISKLFSTRYNIELLTDDAICIDLFGVQTLLMHGDTLCSDDIDYQQFRTQVRDSNWQQWFLSKSANERLKIVANFRETSRQAVASKREEMMDVNRHSVITAMRDHRAHRLIHGHTHQPAQHDFKIDETPASRLTLGAWGVHSAEILVCAPNICQLARWPDCRSDILENTIAAAH